MLHHRKYYKTTWFNQLGLVVQSWVKIIQGFRFESFKRKSSLILFVQNLIIACSNKKRENCLKTHFIKEIKKLRFRFDPGFAVINL